MLRAIIRIIIFGFLVTFIPTTSAYAHVFRASKLGSGTLSSGSFQVIKTAEGNIECTNAFTPAEFLSLEQEVLDPHAVEYRECEMFSIDANKFTVSYELTADGELAIVSPVTISSKVAGECKVTIPAQNSPKAVSYTNSLGKLEIHLKVTGLSSSAEGTECSYSSESNGTYNTTFVDTLEGGIIAWE